MTKWLKRIRKKAYNIFVFLVIGGIVGLIIKHWKYVTFNFEISAFECIALLVTVVLAWWVAEKLEKDSDKERNEKDILIDKLKYLDEQIGKLDEIAICADIVPLSKVITIIGNLFTVTNHIEEVIKERYPEVFNNNPDASYLPDLDSLDFVCTDDADGGMVSEYRDNESICIYSEDRKTDIISYSVVISEKIFVLQILINRA